MAEPFTKEQQLARGERRYTRKVAGPKRWQAIIDAKQGPCRACGDHACGPIEFHHLVPRAIGGGDTESNIVPLGQECHRLVTVRDKEACRNLRLSLTDAEYAYAVDTLGEARFDSRYPVEWEGIGRA
jgi:5-methylcytosine-specific restriction endonuclease McrA